MAFIYVPAPLVSLPVFKSATSVHLLPFHDSVTATLYVFGGVLPPIHNAAVLLFPAPPDSNLVVFRSLTSVQLEPFHVSVLSV